MLHKIASRIIFFFGWLLSPLTFWNDAFINIPISYIMANIFTRFFPMRFVVAVVSFYWFTNILGILMMYLSGKSLIRNRSDLIRELLLFLATAVFYSLVIILLNIFGVLRPIGR